MRKLKMNEDDYTIDITCIDGTISTITVPASHNWISINDTIDLDSITIYQPVEFEDEMPTVAKVEDMCNNYPALEKAYENFKTIYAMVHQDWRGKQDQDSASLF
jgi:hypothetical protein